MKAMPATNDPNKTTGDSTPELQTVHTNANANPNNNHVPRGPNHTNGLNIHAAPFIPHAPLLFPTTGGGGPPPPMMMGFCPPLVRLAAGHAPPLPLPQGPPPAPVGIVGGMHYHGVHYHGVKMDDLVSMLHKTELAAKQQAIAEYQRMQQQQQPAAQTALLQQVLGYVKGIHEQQEKQLEQLEQQQQQPDTSTEDSNVMQQVLEQLQEIKSHLQSKPSLLQRQDEEDDTTTTATTTSAMEKMMEQMTKTILQQLGSDRNNYANIMATVVDILTRAVSSMEEVQVQQHEDSSLLQNIQEHQSDLNQLLLHAVPSNNGNAHNKKSYNHNNKTNHNNKRGFGGGRPHGQQENQAPY